MWKEPLKRVSLVLQTTLWSWNISTDCENACFVRILSSFFQRAMSHRLLRRMLPLPPETVRTFLPAKGVTVSTGFPERPSTWQQSRGDDRPATTLYNRQCDCRTRLGIDHRLYNVATYTTFLWRTGRRAGATACIIDQILDGRESAEREGVKRSLLIVYVYM